jgi:ABC-type sulfate/molybdate transport systems ATPase subunit
LKALIQISDLLVRRGGRTVLEIAALDILEGEILALVGPNGGGKTTLLFALAGLLTLESGTILFEHRPLSQWNPVEYRRKISFVFQHPLLLDMTVADNVALGLRFRGVTRDRTHARVEHWLDQLGIGHLARRRAGELSGGEAQRVSLARAFILDPELLLLDEPFAALDSPARSSLLADLSRLLAANHRTVIIVTHDLGDAAKLSDRVAVIVQGGLRQVAPAREVKSHPADPDVAAFLKEMRH